MEDLLEFCIRNGGNILIMNRLISLFKTGPAPSPLMLLSESEYLSVEYATNARQLLGVVYGTLPLQHLGETIGLEQTLGMLAREHGFPRLSNPSRNYNLLVKQAAFFALYGSGNCSQRAAYASLLLRHAFVDPKFKVCFYSAASKDQFIVMLGNKELGFYVYDPILNHSKIFELKMYQKEILPAYSPADVIYEACKFEIKHNKLDAIMLDVNVYAGFLSRRYSMPNSKFSQFMDLHLNETRSPIYQSFQKVGLCNIECH